MLIKKVSQHLKSTFILENVVKEQRTLKLHIVLKNLSFFNV
jgi:hypothetical protein